MQVHVTATAIEVVAPEALTSLSVLTALPPTELAIRLETAGLSRAAAGASEEHVWLDVAELARRAGAEQGPEWQGEFEAMIGYAASQGWTDPDRSVVRAHVEDQG